MGVCRTILIALISVFVSASVHANNQNASNTSQLKVGRAINIFSRYGYLAISMRVIPRNDTDQTWVFREPTVDVFNDIDRYIVDARDKKPAAKTPVFDGDFHMEFCDNLRQLLQAYFRDFTIERLQKPWRAFSGSWSNEVTARHLGINSSFVQGDHCYVLVRVSRFRENIKLNPLPNNLELAESVQEEMDMVKNGDPSTVEQFIRKFGSHYIASYVTGNSLYQVFVYTKLVYARIKDRLKSRGVSDLSNAELSNYFSPWYAEHMGQIKVASGNQTVEAWAATKLKVHYYIFTYASLVKLRGDTSLLRALNTQLGNEALLQLDLRALTIAFKDPSKFAFFQEVLDNYLKLWEINM